MDKFSLAVVIANLHNNPETLTISQLLVYINDVIASDLPFQDKVNLTTLIQDSLTSVIRDTNDATDIIKLADAIGKFNYVSY